MVVGRVSESPNPDDHWRYYTRVFQMVTELHKVGYQGLRVYPEKHHFRIHFAPSVLLTHAARSNVMSYVSENNYLSPGLTGGGEPGPDDEKRGAPGSVEPENAFFSASGGDGGESNSPSRRDHRSDILQAYSVVYSSPL